MSEMAQQKKRDINKAKRDILDYIKYNIFLKILNSFREGIFLTILNIIFF